MRATDEDYLFIQQGLLPEGAAWPRDPDATLTQMLDAFSAEYARIHNRAVDLIALEADAKRMSETLPEWEEMLGPDACLAAATIDERRAAVVARLTARGGQSRQFFVDVAAALGFEVTISEYRRHTCEMTCEDPICEEPWNFVWQVNAPETTIVESTCESTCETPLRSWGNTILECLISTRKPAHTRVLFRYGEGD